MLASSYQSNAFLVVSAAGTTLSALGDPPGGHLDASERKLARNGLRIPGMIRSSSSSLWVFRVPTRGSHGAVFNNACYNTHDQKTQGCVPLQPDVIRPACLLRDSFSFADWQPHSVTYLSQLYSVLGILEPGILAQSPFTAFLYEYVLRQPLCPEINLSYISWICPHNSQPTTTQRADRVHEFKNRILNCAREGFRR